MAQTYTFVFGKVLTPYHTQSMYKDRFDKDNNVSTIEVLDIISNELELMKKQTSVEVPTDVDSTLNQIQSVIKNIKSKPDDNTLLLEFRQYLKTLVYLGYRLFLFKMANVNMVDPPTGIEAYLYDTNDDLIPQVADIGTAWVTEYKDEFEANLASVVMNFLDTTFIINDFTKSIIKYNLLSDQYTALYKMGNGYMFNATKLIDFVEGCGYKINIIL